MPESPSFEQQEDLKPNSRVAFYDETGRVIQIVEVWALVPKVTAVSNAREQYPELDEKSASAVYIGPVKKSVLN